MENALALKFYQRNVSSSLNSGIIERMLMNILIEKRSIFVLLIILAVQELWRSQVWKEYSIALNGIFTYTTCDTLFILMMEILNLLSRLQNLILIQATQLLRENALGMSKIVSDYVFPLSRVIMWGKNILMVKELDVGKEGWQTKW